jgi:hypothetical protein
MAFVHTGLFSPAYIVSGLLVGVLVGFTGVGGGSLMTPLLVLLFGIHPATAVGTDLLYRRPPPRSAARRCIGAMARSTGEITRPAGHGQRARDRADTDSGSSYFGMTSQT